MANNGIPTVLQPNQLPIQEIDDVFALLDVAFDGLTNIIQQMQHQQEYQHLIDNVIVDITNIQNQIQNN